MLGVQGGDIGRFREQCDRGPCNNEVLGVRCGLVARGIGKRFQRVSDRDRSGTELAGESIFPRQGIDLFRCRADCHARGRSAREYEFSSCIRDGAFVQQHTRQAGKSDRDEAQLIQGEDVDSPAILRCRKPWPNLCQLKGLLLKDVPRPLDVRKALTDELNGTDTCRQTQIGRQHVAVHIRVASGCDLFRDIRDFNQCAIRQQQLQFRRLIRNAGEIKFLLAF